MKKIPTRLRWLSSTMASISIRAAFELIIGIVKPLIGLVRGETIVVVFQVIKIRKIGGYILVAVNSKSVIPVLYALCIMRCSVDNSITYSKSYLSFFL